MKKIRYFPLLFVFCLTLCSCAFQSTGGIVLPSSPGTGVVNPWSDCTSLDEATEQVGFSLTIPQTIAGYDAPIFRSKTLGGAMLEVIFYSGDDEIRIRKAPAAGDEADISGDYNVYAEESTISTAGENAAVTLYGNDGTVSKAIWCVGNYLYSITAEPAVNASTMSQLVMQVA